MVLGDSNNQPRPAFSSPRRVGGRGHNSAIWHMLFTHIHFLCVCVCVCVCMCVRERGTVTDGLGNGIVRTAVQLCAFQPLSLFLFPLTQSFSLAVLSSDSSVTQSEWNKSVLCRGLWSASTQVPAGGLTRYWPGGQQTIRDESQRRLVYWCRFFGINSMTNYNKYILHEAVNWDRQTDRQTDNR